MNAVAITRSEQTQCKQLDISLIPRALILDTSPISPEENQKKAKENPLNP